MSNSSSKNTCLECGFTKECTHDEFMIHMRFHDEWYSLMEELGIEQEVPQFEITITPPEN